MIKSEQDYRPAKLSNAGGLIYDKNGNPTDWYVHFAIRNPDTGEMHEMKKRGKINYIKNARERTSYGRDLVRAVNELLAEGELSPFKPKEPELTLTEQLQKEVDLKKSFLRHRTYQSYEYGRKTLTAWMKKKGFEHFKPKEFTKAHAQMFCDYLTLERKYKGKTFNVMKSFVSVLFNSMADKDIISDNPFRRIKSQRQEIGKNLAFSEAQKELLIDYMKQHCPRLYLVTQFIYFCYIRPAELMRLKVSNVDFKHRKIVIYPDQSKTHRQEQVEIPDAFLPLVESMELEKYGDNDFLFSRGLVPGSKQLSRNYITQKHLIALRALKFAPDFTLYSWKASGVISAYKAGIDIYSIMRQCRHTSINHTMIYLKSLGLYANTEFATRMR